MSAERNYQNNFVKGLPIIIPFDIFCKDFFSVRIFYVLLFFSTWTRCLKSNYVWFCWGWSDGGLDISSSFLDWISDTKISGWVILLLRVPNSDPIFEFCVIYWCKVPILKIIDLAYLPLLLLHIVGSVCAFFHQTKDRVRVARHNEHALPPMVSHFLPHPRTYYTTATQPQWRRRFFLSAVFCWHQL